MLKQVRLYIKGDIIGVGFREWTAIQAKQLGVRGFVRNVGREVEAVLQGTEENLQEMIKKIQKGPPVSRVDEVEIHREEPGEAFGDFKILR